MSVGLPREAAPFSDSASPYPPVCPSVFLPLSISVKSISASSCQSLPWDPGELELRFLFPLCPGLEELVLSEMNSPSRTQTGDSSSVSSFSYREILREKESSSIPARVRANSSSLSYPNSGALVSPSGPSTRISLSTFPQVHQLYFRSLNRGWTNYSL